LETLGLDASARRAGITLAPDTGLAPGLVNSIGKNLIERIDRPQSVRLYCGVLPQHPVPPFNYKLTFNIEGLLTEYDYEAVVLRNGQIQRVETLAELERLEFDGLGEMEAFTTSGGTSTAPYTFQGQLMDYEYKTVRFPGHCERMRIFKDFGFWSEEPIDVDGIRVRPRDVFYRVFGSALAKFHDEDQCVIRGIGRGFRGDEQVELQIDIHDWQSASTNFTSMERLTGFSISIHAIAIANGMVPPGAVRYENALTGGYVLEEIQKRGIQIKFTTSR
jgi:lysine 6-dehydrogenase